MSADDVCALKEIPIENSNYQQTIGAPAPSELFSVGVCGDSKYFKERDMLEIYGAITLYDEHYNTYELYRRSRDDPQTLTPQHNLLSLDKLAHCLVSTSWSLLYLCLMDKADDSVIVREGLTFVKLTDINQYNQVRQIVYKSVFVTYFAADVKIMAGDDVHTPKEIPIKNKDWSRHLDTVGADLPQTIGAPASDLFSVAGDDVLTPKEIPIKNEKLLDHLKEQPYLADMCDLKESWLKHLKTPRSCLPQTIGAHASELFSAGVCRDSKYFQQRDTLQIYGSINLYDKDGTCYDLYTRTSDNPETLTPQHNLFSLDMPAHCLVSTSWSRMSFSLKDKADDGVIVEKDFYFDKLTDINQYNKVRVLGENSVFVTYAAFPAAVLASLKITLIKTNDTTPAPVNLSGKIIARCGNTYGHKYPGIVLLNIPSNQPFEALSNVPIELSRDVVVVPAYSFLRIDLQLAQLDPHQQEDIICQADFLATHTAINNRDITVKDVVVRLNVEWFHPHESNSEVREPFEPPKISTGLQLRTIHDIGRELSLRKPVHSLVEVYGVMIHHDTNSELKICGTMVIRDDFSSFLLFDRNELNPVKFSGNEETIPIDVGRHCFKMCEHMSIRLELKDVEGQVLIEGLISWHDYLVKKPFSWYDERICSVIRGVHGYAAVFYTIFSEAVQVEVRISFKCNDYPDVSHCLRGSVVARHSNGTYVTEYEKTYYQSVLFRGNSSDLKSGCTLPLSKSVVALPIDAFLTVVVDLSASPLSHELPQEHLTSEVYFDMVPGIKWIRGKKYSIEVSIERANESALESAKIENKTNVSIEWSDLDKLFLE